MIPARAGPGRSIRSAAGGGRKNSSLEDVDRLDEFNVSVKLTVLHPKKLTDSKKLVSFFESVDRGCQESAF